MTLTQTTREAWLRNSPRERWMIALAASLVVAAVGYAFVWEPAMRDLAAARMASVAAHARVVAARAASDEIAGLAREVRPPRTADARAAAERVIAAAGVRSDVTAIGIADGRVRVTFAAIDFATLAALIERLGREEQLFVAEALVAARVVPGSVRAELALARPSSP
jgi:type II secretory pathway component PulM